MPGRVKWIVTDDKGLPITGSRKTSTLPALEFSATRVVNGMGAFDLYLPPDFDTDITHPGYDRMVQCHYAPPWGRFSLWRTFFILGRDRGEDASGKYFMIDGPDINHLLTRRVIAAYATSAQADKDDKADDMMKEVVTESIADGVAPTPDAGTRVWADLSIAGDLGKGPTVDKGFAFKYLLKHSGSGVLPGIAKAARENGTEVFFDIVHKTVSSTSIDFIFRTYTGQPGQDLSSGTNQVVFSAKRDTFKMAKLREDYWRCENYIYAAGRGDDDDRKVEQVYDDSAEGYARSQWGRCEGVFDARNQDDDQLEAAGYEALADGRPVIEPSGKPADTKHTRFRKHWDHGDKLRVAMYGQEFDAIAWRTTIKGEKNGVTDIDVKLEYR